MAKKFLIAGSCLTILTGAAHMLGHVQMMHPQPADATEGQLLQLMMSYRDASTGRTTLELLLGFSLAFAILCFATGVLSLLLSRRGDGVFAAKFCASVVGLMLLVSITYWFIAPTACLGLAFACYSAAVFTSSKGS